MCGLLLDNRRRLQSVATASSSGLMARSRSAPAIAALQPINGQMPHFPAANLSQDNCSRNHQRQSPKQKHRHGSSSSTQPSVFYKESGSPSSPPVHITPSGLHSEQLHMDGFSHAAHDIGDVAEFDAFATTINVAGRDCTDSDVFYRDPSVANATCAGNATLPLAPVIEGGNFDSDDLFLDASPSSSGLIGGESHDRNQGWSAEDEQLIAELESGFQLEQLESNTGDYAGDPNVGPLGYLHITTGETDPDEAGLVLEECDEASFDVIESAPATLCRPALLVPLPTPSHMLQSPADVGTSQPLANMAALTVDWEPAREARGASVASSCGIAGSDSASNVSMTPSSRISGDREKLGMLRRLRRLSETMYATPITVGVPTTPGHETPSTACDTVVFTYTPGGEGSSWDLHSSSSASLLATAQVACLPGALVSPACCARQTPMRKVPLMLPVERRASGHRRRSHSCGAEVSLDGIAAVPTKLIAA